MVKKTRRSNEPFKRHHWKAARTARRNRFSHGIKLLQSYGAQWGIGASDFEAKDTDLAFRRRGGWLTADKAHLRWMAEHNKLDLAHPANPLVRRVNFHNM